MSAAPQHKNKFFCIQLARHFLLRMKLLTLGILKTSFRLLLLNRNFENYAHIAHKKSQTLNLKPQTFIHQVG